MNERPIMTKAIKRTFTTRKLSTADDLFVKHAGCMKSKGTSFYLRIGYNDIKINSRCKRSLFITITWMGDEFLLEYHIL